MTAGASEPTPIPDNWTEHAALGPYREGVGAAIGGKLYWSHGLQASGSTVIARLWEYDPATDVWTEKAVGTSPASYAAAGVISGRLHVVAGTQAGTHSKVNRVYDPATDAWSTKAALPVNRGYLGTSHAVVGGKLYVVGGSSANDYSAASWAYDPATDTWASIAPLPMALRNVTLVGGGNGCLYAAGGEASDSPSAGTGKMWRYDPGQNTWVEVTPLPDPRLRGMMIASGHRALYWLGGVGSSGTATPDVWRYDIPTDKWTVRTPMPAARRWAVAAVLNGRMYVYGQFTGTSTAPVPIPTYSAAVSELDSYDPPPPPPPPGPSVTIAGTAQTAMFTSNTGSVAVTEPPPPGPPVTIGGITRTVVFEANAGSVVVTGPPVAIAGTGQSVTLEAGSGIIRMPAVLTLTILDAEMRQAPSSLQITLGGAVPGAALTFFVDGLEIWEETADAEGELGQTSIPIPEAQGAKGAHTIMVTSATGSDSEGFTVLRAPAATPVNQSADAPAVFIPGSTGRWVFQDVMPGGLGSWVMPVNPKTMSNPHGARAFEAEHTTARSGQFHVSETEQLALAWKIAGNCPDEPFQRQLEAYAELERRFYLIDHRGRAWKVAVQDLTIEQRKRQSDAVGPDNDWASNWSMDLVIYDKSWAVVS